jgi:cell division protein FtsL
MTDWSTVWKQTTVLFLVLAGGLALVLFTVKYKVQDLEDELAGLNREIAYERRTVHVLRAEFSHLVEANRLRRLATKHLHMEPIQPDQLGTFASLLEDEKPEDDDAPDSSVEHYSPGAASRATSPVSSPVLSKESRP